MTAWAGETLLATGLLMALALAVRLPVARLWGARAAYALWALPALRLFLPPVPVPVASAPGLAPIELIVTSGQAMGRSGWTDLLLPLWLGGAALFAAWQAIAYRRVVSRALADARLWGEVDGIAVFATPVVTGPVAIGPLRPRILVPLDFVHQPEAERALALAHEALHHKRGDLWANLLACAVLALHWFNPIAWAAHRAFRRDQELACDAAVIGGADVGTRQQYGRALARAAGALPPAPATTLGEASTLKRRLDMLKAHRARTSIAGRSGVAALGLAALGLTAIGGVAAQTAPEAEAAEGAAKVERFIIRRGEGTDAAAIERIKAIREFLMKEGEGAPGALLQRECPDGQRFETSTTSHAGKLITVSLCQRGLSAEEKARIGEALSAAIAEAQ